MRGPRIYPLGDINTCADRRGHLLGQTFCFLVVVKKGPRPTKGGALCRRVPFAFLFLFVLLILFLVVLFLFVLFLEFVLFLVLFLIFLVVELVLIEVEFGLRVFEYATLEFPHFQPPRRSEICWRMPSASAPAGP